MSIRKPPKSLITPNYIALGKGDVIERIHNRNYAGDAFNPGRGSATRFAPIKDSSGTNIPTLYAADTLEAAIFETIFHDVLAKTKKKRVSKVVVTARAHAQLEAKRDLKLASLRQADLIKWGIKRNDLITTTPKLYASSAEWSEAIHHQFSDVEGLVWTSNQCDPDTAYLFFGDRVDASDFKIIATRDGQTDASVLADVRQAGKRSGITITV